MASVHAVTVMFVGAVDPSAPANMTDGDFTAGRAHIGDDAAFDWSGQLFSILESGVVSPTGAEAIASIAITATPGAGAGSDELYGVQMLLEVEPSAANAGQHETLRVDVQHNAGAFDLSSTFRAMASVVGNTVQNVAGTTVGIAFGGQFAYRAQDGTITTAIALDALKGVSGDAGAITTGIGVRIRASAGVTPTTDISLYSPGTGAHMRHVGAIIVGTDATPANNSDGDVELIRLNVGEETAFDSLSTDGGVATDNVILVVAAAAAPSSVNTAMVILDKTIEPDATAAGTGRHDVFNVIMHVQPTAASDHRHLGMQFNVTHDAGAFNLTSVSALTGLQARVFQEVAATTVTFASGIRSNIAAIAGTISTAEVLGIYFGNDGSDAGTIGSEIGIRFSSNVIPSGGVTTRLPIYLRDVSGTGIGNFVGILIATQSASDGETYAIHAADNIVRIGGDTPLDDGQDGLTAITRTMFGLELAADHMNTSSKYTAALKFVSTDAQFTTENPKLLAYIVGVANETYNADNTGGMYLEFGATQNTPGTTNVPTAAVQIAYNGTRVINYLYVGALATPTQTNAGDLTAGRFIGGGNHTITVTGSGGVDVVTTMTDTASGAKVADYFAVNFSPASNSSSEFRTLYFAATLTPATGVTMSNVRGGYFELRNRSDAAIASLTGLLAAPLVIDSSSPGTVGTVTSVIGIDLLPYVRPSGTSAVTVTTMYGLRALANSNSGLTVTNLYGIYIDSAMQGATNYIGIEIEKIDQGSSLNIGIRNRAPYVATPSTTQSITAVGTTLLADAETIQIDANASYTLTSTPTIADGDDGQIVRIINVDSTDVITLQDETSLAGSNLRLPGAANVALGPRDVLILQFISALGDWICIGQVNN